MKEYEISEQLFLDVWESYGCPDEVSDLQTIYNILNFPSINHRTMPE